MPTFCSQVLITGVRGSGYTGDVAIDDISFDITIPCTLNPSNAQPSLYTTTMATTQGLSVTAIPCKERERERERERGVLDVTMHLEKLH